jgi:hypothetical protein
VSCELAGASRPLLEKPQPKAATPSGGPELSHAPGVPGSPLLSSRIRGLEAGRVRGFALPRQLLPGRCQTARKPHELGSRPELRLPVVGENSYARRRPSALAELLNRHRIEHRTHPAPPAAGQRQGRAVPANTQARMSARPHLPLKRTPRRRSDTRARLLQRAQAAQLTRRATADQPCSQRPEARHLAAPLVATRSRGDGGEGTPREAVEIIRQEVRARLGEERRRSRMGSPPSLALPG